MTRGRIVLHVGMHKTGSSAFQHLMRTNRHLLRLCGIDYPDAVGATGQPLPKHNDLFLAISHETDFRHPHPVLGPSALRVAQVAARAQRFRVTVLSAEGLSGAAPAFARALSPLAGPDTRVLIVLRRPDLWVEAFYRQMVLNRDVREARPFRDFLADPATQAHLDFPAILRGWQAGFGVAALRVLPFAGPPLLPRLCAAAGLPRGLALLPGGRGLRNASPHPGVVETLRRANAAGLSPDLRPFRRPGPRPVPGYFTASARAAFLAARADDLRWLQALVPDATLFPEEAVPPIWDGTACDP